MGTNTKKDILLTITMLVSNRPDTTEKCLASMQPLLNAIPSELIVVDTAGNEECMEIVKKYTNKIVHFKWNNDFAAARNAGLRKAKGQWVMYIDDDEWFEDISEIVNFFTTGKYKEYVTAAYVTRNYTDHTGRGYNDRNAVRLTKLTPETQFKGRIHEQLDPLYEPTYYAKAFVHPYGYAFESQEELYEHSWRNINLLTEARLAEKDNWMAGAHLIQEYHAVKEYFSLIAVAKELRTANDCFTYGRNDFTSYATVMEMQAYIDLKRYGEAYALGKEMLKESRLLLNAHVFLSYLMPEVCLKCSDYKEALEYCKLFWEYYGEWKKNEDECCARDPFGLRTRYLNEPEFALLHMIEIHAYVEDKEWDKAVEAFQQIKWAFTQVTISNTFSDLIRLIANTEYEDKYAEALEVFIRGDGTRQYLEELISQQKGEEKQKVLFCISQVPSTDLYIMRYKMQYALLSGDRQMAESLLTQWKDLNYSMFFPDKEYWKGLRNMRINLTPWLSDVGIHDWITLTEALFDQFPNEDCENIFQVLSQGMGQTDIRMMHLIGLQLEKRLLENNMNLENPDYLGMEEIWKELYRIASLWVSCAAMLYQDTVFQGELQSALPPRYRFAWLIFQANAVKEDIRSFVRKVAEAAKAYLTMNEVCRYILRCCKTEAEEV